MEPDFNGTSSTASKRNEVMAVVLRASADRGETRRLSGQQNERAVRSRRVSRNCFSLRVGTPVTRCLATRAAIEAPINPNTRFPYGSVKPRDSTLCWETGVALCDSCPVSHRQPASREDSRSGRLALRKATAPGGTVSPRRFDPLTPVLASCSRRTSRSSVCSQGSTSKPATDAGH